MALETAFVGEGEHLVVHTGGIADAEDGDAPIHQFLGDPIDGRVALGAHQHLGLPMEGLVDRLHQRGGLPGAGRAMYDGHLFGRQDPVDSGLLRGVEPGETEREQLSHVGAFAP